MKVLMGIVVAVVLAIAFVTPAFTQTSPPSVEQDTFTFDYEGASLYAAWRRMSNVREKYGDNDAGFMAFWAETCKLNTQFSCTDSAYRHIPIGAHLVLPHIAPRATSVVVDGPFGETIVTQAPIEASVVVKKSEGSFSWWLPLSVLACGLNEWRYRRSKKGDRKTMALLKERCDKAELLFKTYIHTVETPQGMRQLDGQKVTHFARQLSLDGDPAVSLRSGEVVKVKNLRRALDRLPDDKLRFEGFERTPSITSEVLLQKSA